MDMLFPVQLEYSHAEYMNIKDLANGINWILENTRTHKYNN